MSQFHPVIDAYVSGVKVLTGQAVLDLFKDSVKDHNYIDCISWFYLAQHMEVTFSALKQAYLRGWDYSAETLLLKKKFEEVVNWKPRVEGKTLNDYL